MKSVYGRYFTKAALVWAGCFVLFFFVYMLMLAPQVNSKEQLEKQIAGKKRIYESALKAAQEETRIQLSEQLEHLRDRLKNFVIDFEDSANLTFDISQIANEKEVSSFSIETKKDKRKDKAKSDYNYISESRINISFSTASFNQFAALLNALERHQPVIFVDGFVITRSRTDSSGHQVNMSLSVFVREKQDS